MKKSDQMRKLMAELANAQLKLENKKAEKKEQVEKPEKERLVNKITKFIIKKQK